MGLTVLDTGVMIGYLDGQDVHHTSAKAEVAAAHDRGDRLAIPGAAFAELLVRPLQRGSEAVVTTEDAIRRLPLEVLAVSQAVAVAAAGLRAEHGRRLKLPDALVVATARVFDSDLLVTTDRDWPSPAELGLKGRVSVI